MLEAATKSLTLLDATLSTEQVQNMGAELVAAAATRKSCFPFCGVTPCAAFQYRRHAVIVHLGASTKCGHYISYVNGCDCGRKATIAFRISREIRYRLACSP